MTMQTPPSRTALAWDAESLRQQLQPLLPGLSVECVACVESTNSTLLQRIREGHTAPCLLVSEEQSAGRGRSGRSWHSRPGASLTFSLALPIHATDWSGLSLAVGLAVAEALDPWPEQGSTHGNAQIGLKWPNDLMLLSPPKMPHKLGGILIESLVTAGQRMAVVGIGLNIAGLAPEPMQPNQSEFTLGRGDLQSILPGIDAVAALTRLAKPLSQALMSFERTGFAPLLARYALRDMLSGKPVTTTLAQLPTGLADGIDPNGALWLRVGEQRHRVVSGEVSVRVAHLEGQQMHSVQEAQRC